MFIAVMIFPRKDHVIHYGMLQEVKFYLTMYQEIIMQFMKSGQYLDNKVFQQDVWMIRIL